MESLKKKRGYFNQLHHIYKVYFISFYFLKLKVNVKEKKNTCLDHLTIIKPILVDRANKNRSLNRFFLLSKVVIISRRDGKDRIEKHVSKCFRNLCFRSKRIW